MAGASKNSRTTVATQKFECPECGGEIVMKTLYENGRLRNVAECTLACGIYMVVIRNLFSKIFRMTFCEFAF